MYREALRIFKDSNEYGQFAKQILNEGINRPKKGTDVGDHPPITPMKAASNIELDGDNWKIYDYIVRHFLGTVSIFSERLISWLMIYELAFLLGVIIYSCREIADT